MLTAETRDEIERRALEIAAAIEAKRGPYFAEVVPDVQANWHIVTTWAAQEETAADWLAHRAFGVFVPRFADGAAMRDRFGAEVDLSEKLIFPCRVFVFVWDILRHWRRLRACPGVAGVMVDDRERPVIVPEGEISRIQAMQFSKLPLAQPATARTRRRRYRRIAPPADSIDAVMTISTRSYWHVDGEERNRVLDESLGLAS